MRLDEKCPKCLGRELAVHTNVEQLDRDSVNGARTALPGAVHDPGRSLGWFETWMCLGCGYTELYARGLTGIRELAAQYPDEWRIVDARTNEGPYR